jgi:predicted transcriptional regulator
MGSLNCSLVPMHAIDKNASRESIIIAFNDDVQLVEMLLSYLLHNCCIERNRNRKSGWAVTGKGLSWIRQYGEKPTILSARPHLSSLSCCQWPS